MGSACLSGVELRMRARSEAFGLSLHPDKTRLIQFGRFAALNRQERGLGKPETFNYLGFTLVCGTKRSGGMSLYPFKGNGSRR